MKSTYNDPQVKLNTNRRGKTDYDIVVYGTRSLRKQLDDTVAAAIRRYMEEKEIGTRKLSRLTGIPKGTISRYRNGTAKYDPDYLCAICIALRLQTCRQRHLFRMCSTGRCLTNVAERETERTSSGSFLMAASMMRAIRSLSVISVWSMPEKCPSLRCSLRRRASDDGIFLYALR